jgi:hypothetical protein
VPSQHRPQRVHSVSVSILRILADRGPP